jgi:hypothetical protein
LKFSLARPFLGKVDLIFTAPSFPLNRKKYDNLQGRAYVRGKLPPPSNALIPMQLRNKNQMN